MSRQSATKDCKSRPLTVLASYTSDRQDTVCSNQSEDTKGEGNTQLEDSIDDIQDHSTVSNTHQDLENLIEDLTKENARLQKALRRCELFRDSLPKSNALFELKVYGLSSERKRHLEGILQDFCTGIDASEDVPSRASSTAAANRQRLSSPPDQQYSTLHTTELNTVDSAYASASSSDAKAKSTPKRIVGHNITKSRAMTDEEMKAEVVKRLEHLFQGWHPSENHTGSTSSATTLFHQVPNVEDPTEDGRREAQILSKSKSVVQTSNQSHSTKRGCSNSPSDEVCTSQLTQRPTRPTELDPNREQNTADNVQYIRHLGLSMQHVNSTQPHNVAGSEWLYLNLVINMAQLHMMNVTPDFVRSAIIDLSTKFEMSEDGRCVRWTGGAPAQLDRIPGIDHEPYNAYKHAESMCRRKRRKVEVDNVIPVAPEDSDLRHFQGPAGYKPLFSHQQPSPYSASAIGYRVGCDQSSKATPHIGLSQQTHEPGSMMFYSDMQAYVDYSGDTQAVASALNSNMDTQKQWSHPLGITCSKNDGRRVACSPMISSRKRYWEVIGELSRDTPIADQSDIDCHDITFPYETGVASLPLLMEFNASGTGGTRPADHFVVRVKCSHHEKRRSNTLAKDRFSRSRVSGYLHANSRSSLETPRATAMGKLPEHVVTDNGPSGEYEIEGKIISEEMERLEPSKLPSPLAYYEPMSDSGSSSSSVTGDSGTNDVSMEKVPRWRCRGDITRGSYIFDNAYW